MAAQETAALLIEAGTIYVGDSEATKVNLGSVRNVVFNGEQIKTKVESDNNGTIINKVRLNGNVSFDWLEIGNAAHINELFKGIITRTTTAGTAVTGATQTIASPFTANKFYKLENQMNDGTAPTVTSVSGATDGALTADDDYHLVKNEQGDWGIVLNTVAGGTNITTLSQVVTVTYNYTPAASQTVTGGTNQTATNRYVEIRGPSEDDANLERIIVLNSAVANSPLVIPFVDVETANDVGVMPVTLEGNKGTTWTFTDEINAT